MMEEGVYTAVLTPLREDGSCDHEELARHSFDIIARGCRGIVLIGTTGEGPSFSIQESIEILQKLLAAGFDPNKLFLANSAHNIPDTVTLAKEVLKQGCRAFIVAPPSFFKHVEEEGVIAFYREMIQKAFDPELKILLYHIPQMKGLPFIAAFKAVMEMKHGRSWKSLRPPLMPLDLIKKEAFLSKVSNIC